MQVYATDLSEKMIEQLNEKLVDLGLTETVHTSVQDVQALPEEWAGKFDAVFGLSMIMFAPDRAKALKEIRKCVKPGGVAVISSWAALADNPASSILYQAQEDALQLGFARVDATDAAAQEKIKNHIPVPERRHPNYVFGDPAVFTEALLAAGFSSVRCVPPAPLHDMHAFMPAVAGNVHTMGHVRCAALQHDAAVCALHRSP